MPPSKPTLDDALKAIASNALALREAGVESFTVDGVTVKLAPPDAPQVEQPRETEAAALDPLDDPATFGRKPGSRPPGRRWKEEEKS